MAYQIRQGMCSCCHRCRVLCPKDAIIFKGPKYWINPDKCIECGLCAKNCHNGAIILPGSEKASSEGHQPIEETCDAVVIGAGGSGLLAATRLAKAGKHVIVLEKNFEVGGNTWFASGFHGHYSRLEKEAGSPDRREQEIAQFMKDTDYLLDEKLVRNIYRSSALMMDFLLDECDCAQDYKLGRTPWGGVGLMYHNVTGKQYKRIDASIGPGGMGSFVVEKLMKQLNALKVPVITSCEATELICNDNGAVCGVKAVDAGGERIIYAKAVIMAAGSYSHNPEYLAKANSKIPGCIDQMHFFSVPTCTGDGITMCQKVGADIDWKNAKAMIIGPAHHPYSFAIVCITREPEVVLINQDGKRWACEENNTMGLRDVILNQPGNTCWGVMDQGTLDLVARHLTVDHPNDAEHAAIIANYQAEADAEALMDVPTKKADTLEELAVLMGVPVDTFVSEIKRYNQLCHEGCDQDFGKKPEFMHPLEQGPYYAFYEKLFQENAAGGMKTDSETRVKKTDGSIIPGLYAVGDNAAGVMLGTGDYSDFCERNVSMFTWAMTSGYMVSDAVLKDLK